MDMNLPYFVGNTDRIEDCGVDTTGQRKSLDGTLCIVHMHGITIEQFNAIRTKTSIVAYSQADAIELMNTSEWTEPEVI